MARDTSLLPPMLAEPEDWGQSWLVRFRRDYYDDLISKLTNYLNYGQGLDPGAPKDWGIRLGFRDEHKDEGSCVEPAGAWFEIDHLRRNHLLVFTLCQNARPPPGAKLQQLRRPRMRAFIF